MDEQWENGWVAVGKVAVRMGRELEDGCATAEKRKEGGTSNQWREVYPHAWRDTETTS